MGAQLTQNQALYKRLAGTVHAVTFGHTGDPTRTVKIPTRTWREMGEPHLITVTIEPGDRINGGAKK